MIVDSVITIKTELLGICNFFSSSENGFPVALICHIALCIYLDMNQLVIVIVIVIVFMYTWKQSIAHFTELLELSFLASILFPTICLSQTCMHK